MNKKGQTIIVGFMLGVVAIFLAIALAPALKDTSDEAMNDPMLNCSTTTDDQTKSVCTAIDMQMPTYVAVLLGLAFLIIGGVAIR